MMNEIQKLVDMMNTATEDTYNYMSKLNAQELRSQATKIGIKNSKQYKKDELLAKVMEVFQQNLKAAYEPKIEALKAEQQKESKPELNRHQKLAAKKVRAAYNWIVGGFENSVQDGAMEEMPPVEDMFEQVYDMVMTEDCGEGFAGGCSKTELRFAGKQFILNRIAACFKKDGYEVPEELTQVKEKKHTTGERKNIKGNPDQVGEDEVVMKAFTGMVIGVFKIHKESKDTIYVKTQKGILGFNKKTGLQVAANNPKFANRIEK